MNKRVCLSMFTLLLFEQWEGIIITDEQPHLTQASVQHIHHTHKHTLSNRGIKAEIPPQTLSHRAFHQSVMFRHVIL